MNLHRAGAEGQWVGIPAENQNPYQKVAAATNGVVTPGNAVSLAGAGLVATGLRNVARGETAKGVVQIGAGRIADLADGLVAEKTGTKGPVGEAMDVGIDKTEAFVVAPVLAKSGVLPKPAAGLILGQNLAIMGFSGVAKRRGREIHPSADGKKAMFGQWFGTGMYGFAAVAKRGGANKLAKGFEWAGHLSMVATAALGAKAIAGYAEDAGLSINTR